MSLADLIIKQGPVAPGDKMPFPTALNGHPVIAAADVNELREELIAARQASETLKRFDVRGVATRDDAELWVTCGRCHTPWAAWVFDEPQTLADLVQRAQEHAERCQ